MARTIEALAAAALLAALMMALPRTVRQLGAGPVQGDTAVRRAGAPVHPGIGTLVEDLSIGSETQGDNYLMGRISDLAVGASRSVYIFDSKVPAIREYDVAGKFVRSIGRSGQGPGEYSERANGMTVARDGRVFLRDPPLNRLTIYGADGEVQHTLQLNPPREGGVASGFYSSDMLFADTAGVLYMKARLDTARRSTETGFVRIGRDGRVIDTLRYPEFDYEPATVTNIVGSSTSNSGGQRTTTPIMGPTAVPFAPRPIWALSPLGYYVTGVPERYAFELRVRPASRGSNGWWRRGDPVTSIRVEGMTRVAATAAERAAARARIEDRARGMDASWRWDGPDVPQVKPWYADLEVGLGGRIHVRVHNEAHLEPAPAGSSASPRYVERRLYDIFEPDGRYLGRVLIPDAASVAVRWGDEMWGTVADDYGVETIKRWRIRWGS